MAEILTINSWINNEEVCADVYRDDFDPGKNDEVVARIAQGTEQTLDYAAQAAHKAQPGWEALSVTERKNYIDKLSSVTVASMSDLVDLEVREAGHEKRTAGTDFGVAAQSWNYYNSVIEHFMESEIVEDDISRTYIDKVAKGVCGAIIPWNMPICLTMTKVPLALLTGNTMVVKPPSEAPAALTLLLERYARVLPDGVLNVVNGRGSTIGTAMCNHPLIRKVSFTGGTAGGIDVNTHCAKNLKPATLELGGNDAAVVLDDADIDDMIPKMLHGIFDRSGQICFAIKRIYVPRGMLDRFYEKLCEAVNEIKVGYGLNPESYYGPVMNQSQFDQVMELIAQTKASSEAQVRQLGSCANPELWDRGYYVLPHVVKAYSNQLPIVQKEQFGPVIPVIPYDSVEEAIAFANGTPFGLCSSVWSGDTNRAMTVAKRIQAGQTFINSHSIRNLHFGVPFGGVKDSGIGREFATDLSLNAYVDYHAIRLLK